MPLLRNVANGVGVARRPHGNKTFTEAFEAYMNHVSRGRSSTETRRHIEYDALRSWGNTPISDIKRADVAQFIDQVGSRSPSVARALFAQLRPLFRLCVGARLCGA